MIFGTWKRYAESAAKKSSKTKRQSVRALFTKGNAVFSAFFFGLNIFGLKYFNK